MSLRWSTSRWRWLLLALLAILVLLLLTGSPQPAPERRGSVWCSKGATVEITADKAWSILPGDCIEIIWQLEGIKSLYIDGEGKIGWGEMKLLSVLRKPPAPSFASPRKMKQILTRINAGYAYFLPAELLQLSARSLLILMSLRPRDLWYFCQAIAWTNRYP